MQRVKHGGERSDLSHEAGAHLHGRADSCQRREAHNVGEVDGDRIEGLRHHFVTQLQVHGNRPATHTHPSSGLGDV